MHTIQKRYSILGIIVILIAAIVMALVSRKPDRNEKIKAAYVVLNEGQRYFNKNDVVGAFNKLQQAVAEFEELNDGDGLFESVVYLTMVYDQIGQKKKAYDVLKKVKFREVPNYKTYSSQYYLRMKAYYCATIDKNYKQAEIFTRRAINFSKEKYPHDTAFMYMDMANLAELYIMDGEYQRAHQTIKTIEQLKPVKYQLYLSELYYCRGRLFYIYNNVDSAYDAFNKSLYFSRKYNAFDNQLMVLRMMTKLDSTAGNIKPYIKHRSEYDKLNEKLKGSEVYYKIAVMQEQHKIDMMKHESEKSHTIHILSLCVMFFVILVMFISFILIYKSIKTKQKMSFMEKQRLDSAIEREKLEKELLQLKMNKRDEMLDKAYKDNVAMSLQLVGQQGETDKLTSLEHSLKEMDKDFIKRVETLYPTLSRNDIRLMSFIKMGMASHEIITVLNITLESLHKSRYRLRKKLGLTSEQNLESFINTIT